MIDVNNYKIIAVLLDVGMGTNHLGNLLSVAKFVSPRTPATDYLSYLKNEYLKRTNNVHIADLTGFDNLNRDSNQGLIRNSNKPYILSGHLENFYRNKNSVLEFGQCLVFLGHSTNLNDILTRRTFDAARFRSTYNLSWTVDHIGVPENDIITFDPNLLFVPDITQLITQLTTVTNLNLDQKFCQELHDIWWNNIILKIC